MAIQECWHLVQEDVTLYAPEVSRTTTPDEFLETDDFHHTIITFNKVLIGCKQFKNLSIRDEWVKRYPMGKRVELYNPVTGKRKAGNIIEVRVGDEPDHDLAAIMIYIERDLPPENVSDWVI